MDVDTVVLFPFSRREVTSQCGHVSLTARDLDSSTGHYVHISKPAVLPARLFLGVQRKSFGFNQLFL